MHKQQEAHSINVWKSTRSFPAARNIAALQPWHGYVLADSRSKLEPLLGVDNFQPMKLCYFLGKPAIYLLLYTCIFIVIATYCKLSGFWKSHVASSAEIPQRRRGRWPIAEQEGSSRILSLQGLVGSATVLIMITTASAAANSSTTATTASYYRPHCWWCCCLPLRITATTTTKRLPRRDRTETSVSSVSFLEPVDTKKTQTIDSFRVLACCF